MTPRTAAGWLKFRPVRPGARIALVAPASPFDRSEFDAGNAELQRLGFQTVYDDRVFDRDGFVAGSAAARAGELSRAWARADVDAIMAVRGGYGSVETLPALDVEQIRRARTAFIGYSDVTSVHSFLGARAGLASVHGPMLDGRLARGTSAYDASSFLTSLTDQPLGAMTPDGLQVLRPGDATGTLVGGTLTQLLASFGTPFEFAPPDDHILFIDEVGERPYRLHRMLTQWRLAGRWARAKGVVFGALPRCDEPGGALKAIDVARACLVDFPGPVLFGFPSGHTDDALLTLPFGVQARAIAGASPALVLTEAAAG